MILPKEILGSPAEVNKRLKSRVKTLYKTGDLEGFFDSFEWEEADRNHVLPLEGQKGEVTYHLPNVVGPLLVLRVPNQQIQCEFIPGDEIILRLLKEKRNLPFLLVSTVFALTTKGNLDQDPMKLDRVMDPYLSAMKEHWDYLTDGYRYCSINPHNIGNPIFRSQFLGPLLLQKGISIDQLRSYEHTDAKLYEII